MSLSGISHSPAIANVAQSISLESAKAWGADVAAKIATLASEVFNTLSAWFAQGSAGAAAFYAANQAWLIPLGVAVGVVTVIGVGLAISKRYAAAKAPEAPKTPDEVPVKDEAPANNDQGAGVGSTETPANNDQGAGVSNTETPVPTTPKENEKEEEVSVPLNEMATVTPADFVRQNHQVLTLIEKVENLTQNVQLNNDRFKRSAEERLHGIEARLETLLGYYNTNVSNIDSADVDDSRLNSEILNKLDVLEETANRLTRTRSETAELNNTLSELQGEAGTSRRVNSDLPSPIKKHEAPSLDIEPNETLNPKIAELVHGQQQAV